MYCLDALVISKFTRSMVDLGFLNRFLFVMPQKTELRKKAFRSPNQSEREEIALMQGFMGTLYSTPRFVMVQLSDEARITYDEYEVRVERNVMEKRISVGKRSYYSVTPDFIIKIAALYRIGRLKTDEIRAFGDPSVIDLPRIEVQLEDLERAIRFVEKCYGWYEEIVDQMATRGFERAPTSVANLSEIIRGVIDNSGEEGIKWTDLMEKLVSEA